ncbi:hypothetical protein BT63DRAFT_417762 [Microthyrium microscopicum]|uniref:Uncharacterized protein n=1 Tax=Microthyrium microscopicum TaxID=703497 RepID=A0A6A6U290_9PEZI|nr:hypothetical protein BT63DRAFT_417762 [Microthyrium microscopicum]
MEAISTRQRYAPCETFFVEAEELSMGERIREQNRQLAKMRQRELAAELSDVTSNEYLEEVLDHMERMEEMTMPEVASIDIQHEIKWYMRPFLLDFLTEAHSAFQLLPETLYLTVNILDRYCSRRVVYKRHYQLVACAALLIAAKYGDKKDRVPTFRELRSVCCQLYEEEMFMQMEWHVLQTLDYLLGHPTVDSFLQIALAETAPGDAELMHMTWYICEISLYHRDFVSTRPSVLARSALALARFLLQREQISVDNWAGRYESEIIYKLHKYLEQPSNVLKCKFASQKLSTVAQIVEVYMQSQQPEPEKMDECPVDSGYGTPSTPQKHAYPNTVVQHGCLTPPITPENDNSVCMGYPPPPSAYPTTPSPVPSHHIHHEVGAQQYAPPDLYYGMHSVQ